MSPLYQLIFKNPPFVLQLLLVLFTGKVVLCKLFDLFATILKKSRLPSFRNFSRIKNGKG